MTPVTINGRRYTIDLPDDTPLLWALRDELGLTGTKFGCGMALCGACTVHLEGQAVRSCLTPLSSAANKKVTTIEGIGADKVGTALQAAWIDLGVPQCGYCQTGQIMSAARRADGNPAASTSPPRAETPWRNRRRLTLASTSGRSAEISRVVLMRLLPAGSPSA